MEESIYDDFCAGVDVETFEGHDLRSDLFDDMMDLMFLRQGGSKFGGVRD